MSACILSVRLKPNSLGQCSETLNEDCLPAARHGNWSLYLWTRKKRPPHNARSEETGRL